MSTPVENPVIEFIARKSSTGRDWVPTSEVLRHVPAGSSVSGVLSSVLLTHENQGSKNGRTKLSDTGLFYAKNVLNLQWIEMEGRQTTQRRDPDCLTLVRESAYLQSLWTDIHDKGHLIASRRFMEMEDNLVMLIHLAVRMALEEGFTQKEIDEA